MTTLPVPTRSTPPAPIRPDRRAYGRLLAAAATTGRCPVWITEPAAAVLPADRNAASALLGVAYRDAGTDLAERWPGPCPSCPDCLAPFEDGFPGLLVARSFDADPLAAATEQGGVGPDLLLPAPAARPADVPAVLGWRGTCGAWDDVAGLCAVLRSWEERFGALLVRIVSALELSVAGPPRTEEESLVVAAEHLAFCGTVHRERPLTLVRHARTVRGARRWRFRWDTTAGRR
jgi:hypothetical protein